MNQLLSNRMRLRGAGALALSLVCQVGMAQTIPNPSFEADAFNQPPGYISENSEITGWIVDNPFGAGLSPIAGDTTFANNGTVPGGTNVAFITGGTSLSTTITGLTAGESYKITLRANASTEQTPILRANVDGTDLLTLTIFPVGTDAPYVYIALEFTAGGASASLTLANDASFEHTLLIDDLTITSSGDRWVVEAWTDDATSGVDSQYVYTHAYNFGSSASPVINGVPFTGIAGANPQAAGKFSTTLFPSGVNNDANNIAGDSDVMANDFLYSSVNVTSGTYQTISLEGLTPGVEYVMTVYSVGWESPTPSARWATFSVGEDRLTVNQDQFDNDNGIRISHRYTADAEGRAAFRIAPVNPVNVSIHIYGFSNREAVSRNLAPSITGQPSGITVAQGVPAELRVAASGFPAPEFQWRRNGANIAGATSNAYSIAEAGPEHAGLYDVIVSNSLGAVTSVVARLVVGLPMENPSFEVDSFVSWPGYSGENVGNANTPPGPNVPITGWVQTLPENSGINPISNGEAPFADNGVIPHGRQVAFLQSINDMTNTISQTVSGLTSGSQYYLHFFENSRLATANPTLEATINGVIAVAKHVVPAGGYREVYSDVFIASSSSAEIAFHAHSPNAGDTTALIDNIALVPVAPGSAPFVVRELSPASAPVGGTASFSAQVIGSLPFSYQWFRNGTALAGATNEVLTLTNLQLEAAGEYTLQVSNSGGSVTTEAATLRVTQPIPGLFNTGVDDDGNALPDGAVDPHYQLVVNPHIESTDAIVQDSASFPIVAGPWLANTDVSKWIGPELNTIAGAVGLYTYRTTFDLTGRDPRSVAIIGRWASDNAGRDILVNGVSTGNPQSPTFENYTSFAIYGTNTTFLAGTNVIEFVVENEAAIGYTGLRVEFLESTALPIDEPGTGARLAVTRDGDSITISWSGEAAGQRLQSAADVQGPWEDVAGAANPFTTTASGPRRFFRVVQ